MNKFNVIAIALVVVLSGCVSPAGMHQMTAKTIEVSKISDENLLKNNLELKNISESTKSFMGKRELKNPLIKSEDFRQALEQSLKSAALLASDQANAAYMLEVNLLEVKFLMSEAVVALNIDLEFLVTAEYSLLEKKTGKKLYTQTIATPFVATMSDSFFAYKRMQVGAEGAARANIEKVVDELLGLHLVKS